MKICKDSKSKNSILASFSVKAPRRQKKFDKIVFAFSRVITVKKKPQSKYDNNNPLRPTKDRTHIELFAPHCHA